MKKYDIYISYDKKDNNPIVGAKRGWVTYFQTFLELVLEQILNKKPTFLSFANSEYPSKEQIENVDIMICILSSSFINSKNCIEDIDAFSSTVTNSTFPEKSIYKVFKNPVVISQQPSFLHGLKNYELYKRNLENGEFAEIHDFFAQEAEKTFWVKLIDLAYDIANDLYSKNKESYQFGLWTPATKSTIYLAQTGYDYINERSYIKRELQKHGFQVLPDQPFPTNIRELEVFIRKNLENCALSIHLVGDNYGDIPQHGQVSIAELESKIAEEYGNFIYAENEYKGNDKIFKRIIWISPEVRDVDERQKSFIEKLILEAETLEGVEILQTPIEDLKSIIKKEILRNNIKKNLIKSTPSTKSRLYLLYDKVDQEQGVSLGNYLEKQGYEVLKPAFQGELMDIRQKHIDNLRDCDAAIIHYGKVNEQWVQMKFLDLLKCPGFGRSRPLVAKAIFAFENAKVNYDFYEDYDIDIVTALTFHPESFNSFLAKLDKILL